MKQQEMTCSSLSRLSRWYLCQVMNAGPLWGKVDGFKRTSRTCQRRGRQKLREVCEVTTQYNTVSIWSHNRITTLWNHVIDPRFHAFRFSFNYWQSKSMSNQFNSLNVNNLVIYYNFYNNSCFWKTYFLLSFNC